MSERVMDALVHVLYYGGEEDLDVELVAYTYIVRN